MPLSRTALALAIASLTLPAVATAKTPALPDSTPTLQAPSEKYGWGQGHFTPKPYDRYYGIDRSVQSTPDPRSGALTSSLAGTASPQDFRNPDGADAARAGEIAKAMEHYERSQPATVAAKPASPDNDAPAWPEIAFAGVVALATAGGVVRVRMRRSQRVAA